MAGTDRDGAREFVPPPLIAIALFLAGIALHRAFPAPLFESWVPALAIGLPVLALGIVLNFAAIRALRRAKTDVTFEKPTSKIVREGPYRWSRNPVYLSGLLQFAGLGFALNTAWLPALLPVLYAYFRFWVIRREESHLERRFGEEYRGYTSSVRRWL